MISAIVPSSTTWTARARWAAWKHEQHKLNENGKKARQWFKCFDYPKKQPQWRSARSLPSARSRRPPLTAKGPLLGRCGLKPIAPRVTERAARTILTVRAAQWRASPAKTLAYLYVCINTYIYIYIWQRLNNSAPRKVSPFYDQAEYSERSEPSERSELPHESTHKTC